MKRIIWQVFGWSVVVATVLYLSAQAYGQVTVTGPTEPVRINERVLFDVTGLDAAGYAGSRLWIRPSEGVTAEPFTAVVDGRLVLLIQADTPGVYWFVLAVPGADGKGIDGAEFELQVGEPTPAPPDIDPPDPIPGPGPKFVLVLEESGNRTPGQAATMMGLRAWLLASEHQWRMLDKDVVGPDGKTPEWLVPYLEAAKDQPLPALLISQPTEAGAGAIAVKALPESVAAAIEAVTKGGAK